MTTDTRQTNSLPNHSEKASGEAAGSQHSLNSPAPSDPESSRWSAPEYNESRVWTLSHGEAVAEFFLFFVGCLVAASFLITALPIPFLLFGNGFTIEETESNPITYGAFLTGVVALVGLYYLIEFDYGTRFEGPSGEAVQRLLVGLILTVGLLNVEWEFLAHWPEETPKTYSLSSAPPLLDLYSILFQPTVLISLVATVLVFAICLVARTSLALTARGFDRQKKFLTKRIKQQKVIHGGYVRAARYHHLYNLDFLSKLRKRRPILHRIRLVGRSLLFPLAAVAFFTLLVQLPRILPDVFTWYPAGATETEYSWLLTSLIPAAFLLDICAYLHKRYAVSNGYLISKTEAIMACSLLFLMAGVYLFIGLSLRWAATIAIGAVLIFRFSRHYLQMKMISFLKNLPDDSL